MTQYIDEIIRVTARNRQGVWLDKGIDLTVEDCIKEAKEDWLNWIFSQHSKDVLSVYNIIDRLEKIFYNIEIRHSREQQLCAIEYGM